MVGSNLTCPYKEEQKKHKNPVRKPCDEGGTDWSNEFTNQGMLGIAREHQKQRERHLTDSSL